MPSIEKMVAHAIAIANDNSHGYSQADRWNQDRDCSSLMYDSAEAGGYGVGRGPGKVRYTGTMLADFTAAGFEAIPYSEVGLSGLKRGDVLLNVTHHTEMCIGGGSFVGAHSSETGGIYGKPGDQTGNEISVVAAYVYWAGWDYVLRPPADGAAQASESEDDDMKTEALIYIDDDHAGYKKGDIVYWSPEAGFCYLEHPDCAKLVKDCNPKIHEVHSKAGAPWVSRARQATNPTRAKNTFGKRN